jgi:hypothetical protein
VCPHHPRMMGGLREIYLTELPAAELADRVEGRVNIGLSGPDGGAIPLANLTAADLTDEQLLALIASGE